MKMDYCRICKTQTRHEHEGECAICEYRERLGIPADAVSIPVSIPSPTPSDAKAPASTKKDLQADTKICPHCAESILVAAKKCRHCGEWLDEQGAARPAPPIHSKPTHWLAAAVLAAVVLAAVTFFVYRYKQQVTRHRAGGAGGAGRTQGTIQPVPATGRENLFFEATGHSSWESVYTQEELEIRASMAANEQLEAKARVAGCRLVGGSGTGTADCKRRYRGETVVLGCSYTATSLCAFPTEYPQ